MPVSSRKTKPNMPPSNKRLAAAAALATAIAIDNTAKTITLTISATATEGFAWTKGVYELEMVSGPGFVTSLIAGKVVVLKEVTT